MEYSRIEAWPSDRMKRSRSGQSGSLGSWRITRVNSTCASGARAIAVPVWPGLGPRRGVHGQAPDDVDPELLEGGILHR